VSASLEGGEKAVPGKSYIVTPNHQSHSDILALLLTLPVRFRWVVKKELLRIPFFGWALAATGAVSIDRSKKQEALKRLNEGQSKLADGWSVLIYPEGTRSPDGNLQPLRKGAFLMAVNTGVPILPVTVNGAHKVIPKKTLNVTPGHVTVTIGDPIETEGLTEDDVQALSDKTRDAILKNFNPDYDPFGPNSAAVLQ
jgi:1-acyl-sn-glycerol-3-phosphate acyltransferase